MDTLRIILIILGVVLIAGIYLAEPIKQRLAQWQARRDRQDDQYDEHDSDETLGLKRSSEDELPDEWVGRAYIVRRDAPADDLDELKGLGKGHAPLDEDIRLDMGEDADLDEVNRNTAGPLPADEVIVLTLMAAKGKSLRGPLLLKSLKNAGLVHGAMDIFHYTPEGESQALFSVANILEPGHFVLSEMVQMETPGIALFMQLPACLDGDVAWLHLRNRAEQLAEALSASLCDAQRRPMDEEGLLLMQHLAAGFKAQR